MGKFTDRVTMAFLVFLENVQSLDSIMVKTDISQGRWACVMSLSGKCLWKRENAKFIELDW